MGCGIPLFVCLELRMSVVDRKREFVSCCNTSHNDATPPFLVTAQHHIPFHRVFNK